MLKDVKEGTTTGRKPDTTHVRSSFLVYSSRPSEYGCDKYERANYLRPTGEESHTTPTKADVTRLRNYVRASMDHARKMLDAIEHHEALDPEFTDIDGLRRAAYAADTDTTPGNAIGPSLLPHIASACTSLMMAIEQAIGCGLLPEDPGQPWKRGADRAVSWSVDYVDGSSAMVWHASPGVRADKWQTMKTHAPEPSGLRPMPRAPGCRSSECATRNECVGAAWCLNGLASGMPSEPPPADAAPIRRRFPGCRSNECAIRNRCTGAACCPRTYNPITGRPIDPDVARRLEGADNVAPLVERNTVALDKPTTDAPKDPDAARFAEIEANIQRTKADADKLAEEKAQRDARPAPTWCRRCGGTRTVTPPESRYGAGEMTCPNCKGTGDRHNEYEDRTAQ
jgi:hypothetical protein